MSELFNIAMPSVLTGASDFTSTTVGSGQTLTWTSSGLAGTTGGATLTMANTNLVYAQKDFTALASKTDFRARVYFDLTGMTLAEGAKIDFFVLYSATASPTARVFVAMKVISGALNIGTVHYNDSNSWSGVVYGVVGAGSGYAEIHVKRATTTSSSDGFVKVFVDGTEVVSHTGRDLFDFFDFNSIRVGVSYTETGNTGPMLFDEVVARDDATTIGAIAADEAITLEDSVTVGEVVTMQLGDLFISVSSGITVSEALMTSAGSGNNMKTLLITGTQADINDTVASLLYTSDSGFTGADTLTVRSENATSNVDIDTTALQIIASPPTPDFDVETLAEAPSHRRRVS